MVAVEAVGGRTEGELRPVGDALHEGVDEDEAERGGSEGDAIQVKGVMSISDSASKGIGEKEGRGRTSKGSAG